MNRPHRIVFNQATGNYDVQYTDNGPVRQMRKAADVLAPPGSHPRKASMADDIRALRELVEGRGAPAADTDAAIVAKLQRVRGRRLRANKARKMLGMKATPTEEAQMARERTALGWVLAIAGTAYALAWAAPGKDVNHAASIPLTPAAHSRIVPALSANTTESTE